MTRPHGLKFGTNFRTRRHDQWLDRHQEHRHDVDHGRQSRREPSLRIQVGGRGEAQPRRQNDRCRSTFHPHRIASRPVLSDSRRLRHRLPGRVINYAIANNRVAHEYLVNYTNAAFIIKDGFKLPEDGLFSGFDEGTKTYNKSTWNYQEGGNETGKAVAAAAPLRQPRTHPWDTSRKAALLPDHRAATPTILPRARVIRRRDRQGRRAWAVVRFRLLRFPRMSPTICRYKIRAASINS